ncbi:MAG: SsrA-binding protein SmpB [Clostridia bacterium]|nr:SsrA-binding protein SmpB [Clostridia bacterium]NLF21284.1 SsrA-binding protein SmpB [Clostridiaceae bacterium]
MAKQQGIKIISENRKARHDYFVLETYEAGVELTGTEVKSLRQGKSTLSDSYVSVKDMELFVQGWHIAPYEQGNRFNKDPLRARKLLMHKREIYRLAGRVQQDGLTLVPLKIYFKDSRVKLELGVCKGKKLYDKRETRAKQDADRDIARTLKERGRAANFS